MTDLGTQIQQLKDRIAAAQRARVRAEHDRDAARAKAEQAALVLRTEFGVSTVDEARATLADLNNQLAAALAELRADLDAIGA